MSFALEKTPRASLTCMLVPVLYREYENVQLTDFTPKETSVESFNFKFKFSFYNSDKKQNKFRQVLTAVVYRWILFNNCERK